MRSPARHGEVCPDSQCRTHGWLAMPNFYGRALSIRVCLGRFEPELDPIGAQHDVASRGMPPVIIVNRRGILSASQANVERQEHGSVQHETVSDWKYDPSSTWTSWRRATVVIGNRGRLTPVILLCLCPLSLGVGVRRQLSCQAALGRGGDSVLLPGSLGQCPVSDVRLRVRQRHST